MHNLEDISKKRCTACTAYVQHPGCRRAGGTLRKELTVSLSRKEQKNSPEARSLYHPAENIVQSPKHPSLYPKGSQFTGDTIWGNLLYTRRKSPPRASTWGTWKKRVPAGLLPQPSQTPVSFIHHYFVFPLTTIFINSTYACKRFRHNGHMDSQINKFLWIQFLQINNISSSQHLKAGFVLASLLNNNNNKTPNPPKTQRREFESFQISLVGTQPVNPITCQHTQSMFSLPQRISAHYGELSQLPGCEMFLLQNALLLPSVFHRCPSSCKPGIITLINKTLVGDHQMAEVTVSRSSSRCPSYYFYSPSIPPPSTLNKKTNPTQINNPPPPKEILPKDDTNLFVPFLLPQIFSPQYKRSQFILIFTQTANINNTE